MTFPNSERSRGMTKRERLTWRDRRAATNRKSGGAEDVLAAYYPNRDAAGFAPRETGNEQTETT
jgi:hypothetical protein